MIPVNYLAIIVATVASMVVGFLWYGPVFGKQWMTLMGFTRESMEEAKKKGMGKSYALMALGSLLTVYVLSHVITFGAAYTNTSGVSAGLSGAFWVWLGFAVPLTMSSFLWEGKSFKLWILNAGYYLVSFLVMGSILAGWQ